MEYLPSFRDNLVLYHTMTEEEFKAKKFGLPKAKKFPMPDAAHVRSAIKFFNYAKPSQERELANAILARMEEYGISPDDINVGDDNRFKKYLMESYLEHHGIKGMKWGVRRYQNEDGSLTPTGYKHYKRSVKYTYDAMKKNDEIRNRMAQVRNSDLETYKQSKKMLDTNKKLTPYERKQWTNAMEYGRVNAKMKSEGLDLLDSMNTKLSQVKLSNRNFKEVRKEVDHILDDTTASLKDIQTKYADEIDKYEKALIYG